MDSPSRYYNKKSERAFLLGVYESRREISLQENSLEELVSLAETAGALVVKSQLGELRDITPATFLGKGKVENLAQEFELQKIDLFIFDEELSPTQTKNLEKALKVRVIDRTGLILDIFAQHARSREGKIQVELAQLQYLLPRLVGHGEELSQTGGGIGTRGPGETQLEVDRRKAKARVSLLKKELIKVKSQRERHRERRAKTPIPVVAIVGYTNAGKSTLMNRLTDAGVLVENKLFATVDSTLRRLRLPSGREALLVDTVGFIRKLPHQLIDAFRSTFEEAAAADLLLHLIDSSQAQYIDQIQVVDQVLQQFNFQRRPLIRVFNKVDQVERPHGAGVQEAGSDVFISALTGKGMETLLEKIEENLSRSLHHVFLILPHQAGGDLSTLYKNSRVLKRSDESDGIHIEAELNDKYLQKFRMYEEKR